MSRKSPSKEVTLNRERPQVWGPTPRIGPRFWEAHSGWGKLTEQEQGQAEISRKGTGGNYPAALRVWSTPAHHSHTMPMRITPLLQPLEGPCLPFSPHSLNQTHSAFPKSLCSATGGWKGKVPALKLEQSTAKGFEAAGALLSEYYNESPEKTHTIAPEREKFPSVNQHLGFQVSKFHRNWETIQTHLCTTDTWNHSLPRNGLYQGLFRDIIPKCRWRII